MRRALSKGNTSDLDEEEEEEEGGPNGEHQGGPSTASTPPNGGAGDNSGLGGDGQHVQRSKGPWRKAHVLTKPFTQLHKVPDEVYMCIHICTYTYAHTSAYVYTHIWTCIHTHMHTCICAHLYTQTCVSYTQASMSVADKIVERVSSSDTAASGPLMTTSVSAPPTVVGGGGVGAAGSVAGSGGSAAGSGGSASAGKRPRVERTSAGGARTVRGPMSNSSTQGAGGAVR